MIIPAWFSTPSVLSAVKSSSCLIPFRCCSADKKLPFVPLCLKSGGWCGDFPGSPLSRSGFPRPFVHCLHSKHKIFLLEVFTQSSAKAAAFALCSSADWHQLKSASASVSLTRGSERGWGCFCWWVWCVHGHFPVDQRDLSSKLWNETSSHLFSCYFMSFS